MTTEKKLMANITPFGLRMQPELKGRVEESAKANNRSLNAEIVSRLEQSFVSEAEHAEWQRALEFYRADEKYIHEEYMTGKTTDPRSNVQTTNPTTDLVRQVNQVIGRRAEVLGEVVLRELEKLGVIDYNSEGKKPRTPTPSEMDVLRNAPSEVMPTVLERLAKQDVDGALLAVYRHRDLGSD